MGKSRRQVPTTWVTCNLEVYIIGMCRWEAVTTGEYVIPHCIVYASVVPTLPITYLPRYICRQVDSTVANQPSVKRIGQHLLSSLNHLTIAIIPSSFNNLLPYVPRSLLRYLPTSHTLTLPTSSSTTFLSARG